MKSTVTRMIRLWSSPTVRAQCCELVATGPVLPGPRVSGRRVRPSRLRALGLRRRRSGGHAFSRRSAGHPRCGEYRSDRPGLSVHGRLDGAAHGRIASRTAALPGAMRHAGRTVDRCGFATPSPRLRSACRDRWHRGPGRRCPGRRLSSPGAKNGISVRADRQHERRASRAADQYVGGTDPASRAGRVLPRRRW